MYFYLKLTIFSKRAPLIKLIQGRLTATYLLVFTFGHLQAKSFMCTHKYVFPRRSLESRARLYTDWTLIENFTQSSTVSRSKTFPRIAVNMKYYVSGITHTRISIL
jgi:hypothetical protein